ncbi:hypothetical protein Bbelb_240780 [Branchiostoma belcheri]|nr:hypothetical protein Bbelb_240780 [Branchiostoma belcheri]
MGNDTDGRGSNLKSTDNLLLMCGVAVGSCGVAVGTCGVAVGLCGVVAESCGVAAECSTRNQEVPGSPQHLNQLAIDIQSNPYECFLSLVKKRKLQWFGHVTRAKCTLAHTTLQGKAEDGRLRGRPRRSWTSDLKERTGNPLSHLTSLAENRPG